MPPANSNVNRRQFIAAAAGGLAVVGGLADVARAAGEAGDDAADAGAAGADALRVAVVGTGGRGSDLIRKITTIEGARLVAICDDYEPHLNAAAAFAGPDAVAYGDYRQMLERTKPQVVVVATPLHMHFPVCSDAIDAGADVFCEKTMCYGVDEARKLAAKVEEKKVVFQVGLQRRANPIYQQARAMVDAGMIGRITAIKSQWHRNGSWRRPVPVPRDDKRWPDLERRLNWRLFKGCSRGLMSELGSHQMDVANWMLGAVPRRVTATGGIDYWRDGREVADNLFCTYEYVVTPAAHDRDPGPKEPYTVRVTYSSICANAFDGASELIMGTRGTILLTEPVGLLYTEKQVDAGWARQNGAAAADRNAVVVTSGKTLGFPNDPWAHRGTPTEIQNDAGEPTREQLVSFFDHVRSRDVATICDVRAGLLNTATVGMAIEAIETARTVEFPADLLS